MIKKTIDTPRKTMKTKRYKPSLDEVISFGNSLGFTEDVIISNSEGCVLWHQWLHEIAHWSVEWRFPDWMQTREYYPDEWGARAWQEEILVLKNWARPPKQPPSLIWINSPMGLRDGKEQLEDWGISPLKNLFLATKDPVSVRGDFNPRCRWHENTGIRVKEHGVITGICVKEHHANFWNG